MRPCRARSGSRTSSRGETRAARPRRPIRSLGPRILGYLHAILRDESDAGEAFSIFAESLWRGLPGFRGECAFRTWAYKLAWNSALRLRDDAYRRRGRRLASTEASRLAEEVRTRSGVRRERQSAALEKLRADLSPEEQSLLVLRIDQELPWEDVAVILSAPGSRSLRHAPQAVRAAQGAPRRRAREEGLVE